MPKQQPLPTISFSKSEKPTVDLGALIAAALDPYRGEGEAAHATGEPVALRAKLAMPLGLVLHELVTNAVKYGALGPAGGTLDVTWRREDSQVRLTWAETLDQPLAPPTREGFGSQLMANSARQLSGSIDRSFTADGLAVFPVEAKSLSRR